MVNQMAIAYRIYRNSTVWMSFSYRSLASTGGIPLSALNPFWPAKPPPSVAWVPFQQALRAEASRGWALPMVGSTEPLDIYIYVCSNLECLEIQPKQVFAKVTLSQIMIPSSHSTFCMRACSCETRMCLKISAEDLADTMTLFPHMYVL